MRSLRVVDSFSDNFAAVEYFSITLPFIFESSFFILLVDIFSDK